MVTGKLIGIIRQVFKNRKRAAFLCALFLIVIIDIAFITGDLLFGEERGVLFSFRLVDLILGTNLLIVVLILFIYFFFSLTRQLRRYFLVVYEGISGVTRRTISNFVTFKHALATKRKNGRTKVIDNRRGNQENINSEATMLSNTPSPDPTHREIPLTSKERRSKLGVNILVSFISVLILIFIVELIFYPLLKYKKQNEVQTFEYNDGFLERDSIMGYVARKNRKTRYTKYAAIPTNNDTLTIFDVTYTIDSLGCRALTIPDAEKRSKYAAFFGCSFTFGLGLNDDETIPYYFSKKDTTYRSYNFALGGYGPQHTLALLQYNDLRKIVQQDSGVGFYIYIGNHVARAIGDMSTYLSWVKDFPYYDYKDDSLYHFGTFYKDRKLISGFYDLLGKSNFMEYFQINIPPTINSSHYRLTSDIIYQAFCQYKRTFGNDNFYVVVYPSHSGIPGSDIMPYLKDHNLKVIDFSNLFNVSDSVYYISKYDHHPTPLANEIIGEQLANTLRERTFIE